MLSKQYKEISRLHRAELESGLSDLYGGPTHLSCSLPGVEMWPFIAPDVFSSVFKVTTTALPSVLDIDDLNLRLKNKNRVNLDHNVQ